MAGVRSKPQPNGKYQGWYGDYTRQRVFFIGTRKEAETRRMAERLEDEHRQIRLGYRPVPNSAAKHAKRPFSEVREEYLAWGKAQGGRGGRPWGRTHARERENKLAWWEGRLSLETLADLTGVLPRVEAVLRELQTNGRKTKGRGLSGKSLANYADALRSFCNWAKRRGYLDANPLDSMAPFDTTPKTMRRAMTPEEIRKILAAAPDRRRILYEVAFTTGLRAGELRALSVDNVDAERGALILDPAWTKNRKPGLQLLPRALVGRLVAFGQSGTAKRLYERHYGRKDAKPEGIPEAPLLFVPTHTARDLREDVEAAGVPVFKPGEGKVDFHACRVAYVTLIMEAGATVKEGQALARHATPGLTMNVYARARNERLAELIEKVGGTVLSEQNRAVCVHKAAAGAEGLSHNALQGNTLQGAGNGGGGGNRTRVPVHFSRGFYAHSRSFGCRARRAPGDRIPPAPVPLNVSPLVGRTATSRYPAALRFHPLAGKRAKT